MVRQFAKNLVQPLALLLRACAALALVADMPQLTIAIACVVVINAVFSFVEEHRGERAVAAVEVGMVALLAYVPGLQRAFHTSALSGWEWLFLTVWPPVVLGAEELRKAVVRRRRPE